MGEARRKRDARADAYASGKVFQVPPQCPSCGSPDVHRIPTALMHPKVLQHIGCDIEVCGACRAVWEAFPVGGYVEDPVCAEPCDNCAFRPGSPEQQDQERWRELMESLKGGNEGAVHGGRFYCHKGVPIDMTKGPGNFLFPQKAITMDGKILRDPATDEPVMTHDVRQMRTCSGFLRMLWARAAKSRDPGYG